MKALIMIALTGIALCAVAPVHAQEGPLAISKTRAAAIHQCSTSVQRYAESTFSSLEFELYRACMAQRGQIE